MHVINGLHSQNQICHYKQLSVGKWNTALISPTFQDPVLVQNHISTSLFTARTSPKPNHRVALLRQWCRPARSHHGDCCAHADQDTNVGHPGMKASGRVGPSCSLITPRASFSACLNQPCKASIPVCTSLHISRKDP